MKAYDELMQDMGSGDEQDTSGQRKITDYIAAGGCGAVE